MKYFKISLIAVVLIGFLLVIGNKSCQKKFKHFKSGTIGLKRKVTLYNCDGDTLREWEGRFKIELNGSTAAWIDDGKEVKISGTFVVEELK